MLVYGLAEDAAFDRLKWPSQSSNIKLRRLAGALIDSFRDVRDEAISSRSPFDHALLAGDVERGRRAQVSPTAN